MPAHRLPRRKCFTAVSAGDTLSCRIDYGLARRLSLKVAFEKRRRPELFPTSDTKFFTDFHLCIGHSGYVSVCVSALPIVYRFVYRVLPSGYVSVCVSALPIVYLFVYRPFRLCIFAFPLCPSCVSTYGLKHLLAVLRAVCLFVNQVLGSDKNIVYTFVTYRGLPKSDTVYPIWEGGGGGPGFAGRSGPGRKSSSDYDIGPAKLEILSTPDEVFGMPNQLFQRVLSGVGTWFKRHKFYCSCALVPRLFLGPVIRPRC